MKNKGILFALAITLMAAAACRNAATKTSTDTTAVQQHHLDSLNKDTSAVKQADSLHSYRNDRSTDSVAVGKTIPAKP